MESRAMLTVAAIVIEHGEGSITVKAREAVIAAVVKGI